MTERDDLGLAYLHRVNHALTQDDQLWVEALKIERFNHEVRRPQYPTMDGDEKVLFHFLEECTRTHWGQRGYYPGGKLRVF